MANHRLFAAVYDRAMAPAEAGALGRLRGELLARAHGRVLEVGAGTGVNLLHYGPSVESVVACEPDVHMRRRLLARVPSAAVAVEVHDAGLPGLPFADASFDTVVCTLVLCSVDDVPGAVADLRRVLHPDGRLLFLEHVRGAGLVARAQSLLAPAWRHLAGGCHLDRDTMRALRDGGLAIADCERPPLVAGRLRGILVIGDALTSRELGAA